MTYYHATKVVFIEKQKVSSSRKNAIYEDASSEMDKTKPANSIGREYALYVTDDPDFAVYYLMKEGVPLSDIMLYEVTPQTPYKSPFAVTNQVHVRLNSNRCVSNLVNEYWNPSKNWSFYEYLTGSFDVVKQIELPNIDEGFLSLMYNSDVIIAEGIS
ncbi:hypothetical protein [Aliivibrio fischeri]|uniref:hypothetical protein n=1 Tax=Aliivibrio fischeri TaxID=668 RepID=UPI00090828B1|nr:hypothetical protein [Aliivibrio fischeri]